MELPCFCFPVLISKKPDLTCELNLRMWVSVFDVEFTIIEFVNVGGGCVSWKLIAENGYLASNLMGCLIVFQKCLSLI